MDTTAIALPIKAAERQPACPACWSSVNWCESFDKFGHAEGDDCVHTNLVAQVLRQAGYHVKVSEGGLHNTVITEIGYKMSDGSVKVVYTDDLPAGNRIGYTDPHAMLPTDVVKFLDDSFGTGEFFG